MQARIVKMNKVLLEYTILKIPVIQRPFSWNEEEVKQFVDDVIEQGKNKKSKEYFIGTIIIKEEEGTNWQDISDTKVYEGQQRAIVSSFIPFGLYLFYRDNPELKPENINEKTLLDHIYIELDEKRVPKLKLNRQDQIDYQNILDEKFEGNNSHMYKMFKIVQKRINKTNHRHVYAGFNKLKVIRAELSDADNADLVFDTVNTRGKELGFVDKLRNVCLLNLDEPLQKETYLNKWIPFYEQVKEHHFDIMLSDWVAGLCIFHHILSVSNAKPDKLIKQLRSFDPIESMDLITEYNNVLINMLQENRYGKIINHLFNIQSLLGVIGVYLIDHSRKEGNISDNESKQLVSLLTSYCIRSWILGKRGHIRYLISNIDKVIQENPLYLYPKIYELFDNTISHSGQWEGIPTDEEIKRTINKKQWTNDPAKRMLVLLETELNNRCGDITYMSLEHILPTSYVLSGGTNVKQLLGNLTLIPSEDNSRLSNKDFLTKKQMKGGFNESSLKIDEYVKMQEMWDEPEIKERTSLLSEEICRLWPEKVKEI